jgi:hypothetical protein
MADKSRAAFEKWYMSGDLNIKSIHSFDSTYYTSPTTRIAWVAWQASRELAIYETVYKAVGIIQENAEGCSLITESILLSQADAIKELLNDQTIKNRKNPVRCAKLRMWAWVV